MRRTRRDGRACNPAHPACNPAHPACDPAYPACNPVHAACNPLCNLRRDGRELVKVQKHLGKAKQQVTRRALTSPSPSPSPSP